MSKTQQQPDETDSHETTVDADEETTVIAVDAVVGDDTDEADTYPVRKAGEMFDGPQNIRSASRRVRPYEDETATCNYCGADVDGEDIDSVHAANDDEDQLTNYDGGEARERTAVLTYTSKERWANSAGSAWRLVLFYIRWRTVVGSTGT